MAISGTTLKEYEFYDVDTDNTYKVELEIKDIIIIRLLEANNKYQLMNYKLLRRIRNG